MKNWVAIMGFMCGLAMAQSVNPFELQWMNAPAAGKVTFKSPNFRDSVFVMENYFNGCHFCHENAPNVDRLAQEFVNEPRVWVLDVGTDRSDSQYDAWIQAHSPNHPVLKDGNRVVTYQLGTSSFPSAYVIDCEGQITADVRGHGWDSFDYAYLVQAVHDALQKHCP